MRAARDREPFGALPDGRTVERFRLSSDRIEMHVITYGGIVTALLAPDRHGQQANVVLGHRSLAPYLVNAPYLGAVIGRYANRIARARFQLDGREVVLDANDGVNHLHGGRDGFHHQLWRASAFEGDQEAGVTLERVSPDGESGYPGTLVASVTYRLIRDATIQIVYRATTSATTVVNMTQHSYFNLSGGAAPTIDGHELTIDADHFTPVGDGLIPTGEVAPTASTPFDFAIPARIGARLDAPHEQLRGAGGFDHNWVLRPRDAAIPRAAVLHDPLSGRVLTVETTEPGLQFYDGHLLKGETANGETLPSRAALCLETQHFPDSPNHPAFPSTVLRADEHYESITRWHFSVA